jgi:hypothetical protein
MEAPGAGGAFQAGPLVVAGEAPSLGTSIACSSAADVRGRARSPLLHRPHFSFFGEFAVEETRTRRWLYRMVEPQGWA